MEGYKPTSTIVGILILASLFSGDLLGQSKVSNITWSSSAWIRQYADGSVIDEVRETRTNTEVNPPIITSSVTLGGAFCLASQEGGITVKNDTTIVNASSVFRLKQPDTPDLIDYLATTASVGSFFIEKTCNFRFYGSKSDYAYSSLTFWDFDGFIQTFSPPAFAWDFEFSGVIQGPVYMQYRIKSEVLGLSEVAINVEKYSDCVLEIFFSDDVSTYSSSWGLVKSLYR